MAFLDLLSRLLHHYIVVCIALAIIPLKLTMIRLSKDRAGEVETLFAIPEDLCYVTIGLLLSSLTGQGGAVQAYFSGREYPRTDAALVLFLNFVLAFFVHKIAFKWTRPGYQTYRAAADLRINRAQSSDGLDLNAAEDQLLHVFGHHLLNLLFSLLVQFVLAGIWLYWIARVFRG